MNKWKAEISNCARGQSATPTWLPAVICLPIRLRTLIYIIHNTFHLHVHLFTVNVLNVILCKINNAEDIVQYIKEGKKYTKGRFLH